MVCDVWTTWPTHDPSQTTVSLLAKEDEDSCRELCKQVVDEWVKREMERTAQGEEVKDNPKELTGKQCWVTKTLDFTGTW